ncbi:OLC1v1029152C2 [Oldenlandia corymbosa var. corymbosa]|uniref:Inositol oxygenase n=1 Tax=Oldenlandia corymbosa var. corymbosa TaxID=529605 RepID=A0AAV1CE27_OLDCO|nr:OLC1v1029152C2 [Oldenlandia corymbosa var. corymbosa]
MSNLGGLEKVGVIYGSTPFEDCRNGWRRSRYHEPVLFGINGRGRGGGQQHFFKRHTKWQLSSSLTWSISTAGPVVENQKNVRDEMKAKKNEKEEEEAFVVPDNNAFGHSFRDYEKESERSAGVEQFYRTNHINQTYEFSKKKREEYGKHDRAEMSIWECCELLNEFVDESDPDLDEPQIEHLLQSAEAIRRDYPDDDWLHLTALIHDLGKILLHEKFGAEPQWCVVGDTYPLGCAFDESIVHYKHFKDNPDFANPVYQTKLGIYKENCGINNVTMSWGHDEYMYMVMKKNNCTLPPAAFFVIRFHSFYPLHRNGAYSYLLNDEDKENLKWLHLFNKYDLYSKSKVRVDVEKVKPYYLSLIEKVGPKPKSHIFWGWVKKVNVISLQLVFTLLLPKLGSRKGDIPYEEGEDDFLSNLYLRGRFSSLVSLSTRVGI